MSCTKLLVVALGFATSGCIAKSQDVIGDTDGEAGGTGSGSDGVVGSDGEPGATATLDAGESDDGEMMFDAPVDCAVLPAAGPTIGGGVLGPTGFPVAHCDPTVSGSLAANGYRCCSTDAAAQGGALPDYAGKNIANAGVPYFADANNGLGRWGMCVASADIPAGSGLITEAAENCPVPCNPTWETSEIDVVCGASRVCCQAHELQPEDCVQDEDGNWRPVTGHDIGGLSTWAPGEHTTHQDPNGTVCSSLGPPTSPEFIDCVRQLTVADQRGVCMSLAVGQGCPLQQPGYQSACDLLNQQ